MPDFQKVINRPFTITENKMQYWLQSRSNLQPAEIQSLLYDVCYVRYTSKTTNTQKLDQSVILSLCGFCPFIDRDVFLRMVRYAFQPRLVYASEVANNQWEAILVLNSIKYSPQLTFDGRDQFVDHVQKFCDIFKLSICVMELLSWTDSATITAIQRIQKGLRLYGNWENAGNNELRLKFEEEEEARQAQEEEEEARQEEEEEARQEEEEEARQARQERQAREAMAGPGLSVPQAAPAQMNEDVRRVTNMGFTGNMLHLFHELRNTLMDNAHLSQTSTLGQLVQGLVFATAFFFFFVLISMQHSSGSFGVPHDGEHVRALCERAAQQPSRSFAVFLNCASAAV
jgi:hypothetical protein